MKSVADIVCPGTILAIEYVPDKQVIAVALSDRTILFYDSANFKTARKLKVPSTQRCLCYVKRKRTLFSAGTNGATFGWDLEKIFSNEYLEEEAQREKSKKEFDYKNYITEKTPWFIGDSVLCVVDLPNINFLATGSYDKKIRLWDLRSSAVSTEAEHDGGGRGTTSVSGALHGDSAKGFGSMSTMKKKGGKPETKKSAISGTALFAKKLQEARKMKVRQSGKGKWMTEWKNMQKSQARL